MLMIRHCRQAYPRSGVPPARRTGGTPECAGRGRGTRGAAGETPARAESARAAAQNRRPRSISLASTNEINASRNPARQEEEYSGYRGSGLSGASGELSGSRANLGMTTIWALCWRSPQVPHRHLQALAP